MTCGVIGGENLEPQGVCIDHHQVPSSQDWPCITNVVAGSRLPRPTPHVKQGFPILWHSFVSVLVRPLPPQVRPRRAVMRDTSAETDEVTSGGPLIPLEGSRFELPLEQPSCALWYELWHVCCLWPSITNVAVHLRQRELFFLTCDVFSGASSMCSNISRRFCGSSSGAGGTQGQLSTSALPSSRPGS